MLEGRCPDVPDLRDWFPTLLRPLRSCGATAGLEEGDTHRPRLPVWASCRMRCNCLFIILGPGWGGSRGRRGGLRLAAPGPACFPARFAPDGWAALWLPGPPRSSGWRWRWRSPPPLTTPPPAPRSLLSPSLESRSVAASGPQRPPGRSPGECLSVCLSAVPQIECGILLPALCLAAAAGGGKQVSRSSHRCPGYKQPLLS